MERLTMKIKSVLKCAYESTEECVNRDDCYKCIRLKEMVEMLAQYEDTNLTPEEIEALKQENQGLKANSMIQEHIIQSGSNPLYKDKIITLIMENSELNAKLQKVERERSQLGIALDKAIEKMRNMGWCTGCTHFKGLKGCGLGKLSECNDNNDLYVFFGLEDTTCE